MKKHFKRFTLSLPKGFTLIEILIVVAILGLILVAVLMSMRTQRQKAEDARVKADLERLRIAFEDYYNDNNCYPPATMFDAAADCNSTALAPYMTNIPCDPRTEEPYVIEYVGGECSGFRLYGLLNNSSDPSATALCSDSTGYEGAENYGVSSSNTTVTIHCNLAANAASPFPSTIPGSYACQWTQDPNGRVCKSFADTTNCPITFQDSNQCQAYCPTAPQSASCN